MIRHAFQRFFLGISLLAIAHVAGPPAMAQKNNFEGDWVISLTIPEGPGIKTKRTLALTVSAAPRGGSLHGRAVITDEQNRTFAGVWRQQGKKMSLAFELPCDEGEHCGSVILMGKVKQAGTILKKGKAIVMWDTPNRKNHAQFDTSNGKFTGARLPSREEQ